MTLDEKDVSLSTAAAHDQVRQLEVGLLDQGIALFPSTKAGELARALWKKIRTRVGLIEISPSTVGLSWHRMELKRARDILVEMGLIRRTSDGLYVVGHCDPLDELARERFLDLKLLESVLVALSGLTGKSNTRKSS
jgi:hypothetical protein